ncbi:MAG TPA: MBL fold metallo-hydrolase [Vicinamibacterales bacterium]|nr:MBL fold metallo-hydrolase [Vicinamibacterales bacterium]
MRRLLVLAAIICSVRLQADGQDVRLKPDATPGGIRVLKVRDNVSMLQTPGGNITVLAFPEGLTLVDSGLADAVDKVTAAIRSLSPQPIRYIINTSADPGHIGGNDKLGSLGVQITGGNVAGQVGTDGAEIIAHENVLERMSAPTIRPPIPARAMPQTTYHIDSIKLSTLYHGDGIQVFHVPAAHTDGDSLVYFRHHDVLATGDVFLTTTYPVIDLERGGSINGIVDALNRILDIAFPDFRLEGGTLIVPGHGRVSDSADVAYYRDMVTIVRDRVQDMIKKGMTLDQVKAARPTRDYDPRYGSPDVFVEAAYRSLRK